ncbi:MAG TPA: PKD domain-containing protein, partial [Chitinophagaceae bacterium]|nr:PKD domain-containing protein [Chitinophagaceae bacterium]
DTGYFTVTLTVFSNGCPASVTIPNYIYIKPPISRFVDSMDCATPYMRWFRDRSIGATSWFWDFGDGATSTAQDTAHLYAAPGTYTVSLTVRNDTCEHTSQQTVTIIDEKADFAALNTVTCRNSAQTFNTVNINTRNIAQYKWNFGDGSIVTGGSTISYTYKQSGQFDVKLIITDLNGCRDSLLKPLYIEAFGPKAGFIVSPATVCAFTPVLFTDTSSSDGTHPITQWRWKYGDGVSDTLTAPPFEHSYSKAGLFTITLVVTDSKGCTDSVTRPRAVSISKPSPLFNSPDTLSCVNKPIRFINQTSSNGPTTYAWDFGDGQTSANPNPTHNYALEGAFVVKLTATDRYGCIDSTSLSQYIGIFNPAADFSISDSVATCPPLVVNFTNLSAHDSSYMWDFGDNTRTALPNPRHFYSFPGTYQAKLTITSHGGCTDVSFHTITIRGPEGSFTYDNPTSCSPDTVHFVGTTKDKASFTWDFGDGTVVATGDSVLTHIYVRIGNYLPKMILTDPGGCRVPYPGPDTIQVYGVNANFGATPPTLCDSGLVRFTDSSKSNDPIISYQWDFGDGGSSASQNPTHDYASSGLYPIQLVVKTALGCVDTKNLPEPIRVVRSPVLEIVGDTGKCAPALLQFDANLLRPDTSVLQWKWDFGNGSSSKLQNPPPVNYVLPGDYIVVMTGTNSTGCADTIYKTVHSYPMPVV